MNDPDRASGLRPSCACGCGGAIDEHRETLGAGMRRGAYAGVENYVDRVVETTLLNAIAPDPTFRRAFLKAVGASTALAAISQLLPLTAARAIAQEAAKPEKTKLNVGYVPITCTVPLLLAHAMGEYGKEGLEVNLARTPGWAIVRDKLLSAEFDASHLVLAMPMTMTMGVGGPALNTYVSSVQNVNGNAITLAVKHKDRRDPKDWKGFKFGIPHQHSMHAMLLRYYLAENGLDPDRDVELRVFPPPDSVANMAAGNLDGMLFAEPWGQRAVFEGVGFLHMLTRDIFPNHPCCVVSVTDRFIRESPNSYGAMFRAVVRATEFADKAENRKQVAELLAPAAYLNQPRTVLEQVLMGRYADGLGKVVNEPDRIGFKPFPYESTAVWLLTQLRRWNMVPADIDYQAMARQVFLATDAAKRMREIGFEAPSSGSVTHVIMGKAFDPSTPQAYVDSFAIKRA
ncbi:CmpA/NrtA family ABC transporter substrate-binding protein [Hansschlegelia zhihuaiae]|uniref:Nitrate ABC transporter substrate-binding protein n=1 Tax=Hansschlegelia zhihuaiae TaxID=405005 RepID=A0A4Q0MCR8_9HYPH|nr:CmpA/NrtA family ABC transporter substrate-binding protein [Hansschlegelia zhihuaiae]RXF70893.1 nitrate ABC transporter substrate-binding protein [Hansschlegelia zhihuaiae]